MTCIEKLRELHPDWDDEKVRHYIDCHCPMSEYIHRRPVGCGAHGWEDSDDDDCEKCWNREVYEDESCNKHAFEIYLTGEDGRRLKKLADRPGYSYSKVVSVALRLLEDELNTYGESVILEVKSDG